jgi:sigma-B regulation protein RsbU (phosphoserine phosphatase)
MRITEIPHEGSDTLSFDIDPSIGDEEKGKVSVLTRCAPLARTRSVGVGAIASGKYYVHESCLIEDLVSEMNTHETLLAVGMIDDDGRVLGIIIRRELFNLLGRSYGGEFVRNRTVGKLARDVKRFRFDTNIFSVAENISEEIRDTTIHHFLLEAADGSFAGTFSTRDILLHLSDITKQDLSTAMMIQHRIVPAKGKIRGKKLEAAASVQMAKGVGGDFYAMQEYAAGRYFLCIADVSGKGMAASLITSIMGALVQSHEFADGIPNLIRKLNAYIHKTFDCEKYLTAIFADIDENSGTMTIWDMGHSHLYVFRSGSLMTLKTPATNIPIGIEPQTDTSELTVRLRDGDILLLFTDGVVEQCNMQREEYGLSRITSILRENSSRNIDEIRDLATADINAFRGEEPQHDDISFLLARYTG